MKNKRVAVLLKYFKGELNPFDGSALECALEFGFTDITAVTMSPASVQGDLKNISRLGVKTLLVTDGAFSGSDTVATSLVLAKTLERENFDLIFCGRQSVDGDTSQVPPMLARRLKYDIKTGVIDLQNGAFVLRSGEKISHLERTVLTFERCRTLRFPSIFSKPTEGRVLTNADLNIPLNLCGLNGSPSRVIKTYESDVGRRFCKFVSKESLPEIIRESLKKRTVQKVKPTGEKLDKVCYVGNVKEIAESVGENVFSLDINGVTVAEFIDNLNRISPKAVLFEDDEKSKIFGSAVAVELSTCMCADCISFRVEKGTLIMTRPAQGGNVTADIVATSKMAFATVRTDRQDCSDVVFSVGNGGAFAIDKIKRLAENFQADLCCSRIVADSGKMPYSAQVGLTGKRVSPKVYVTFGISGAVQHTSAISGAGTVIAIDRDKNARIFDYADYGVVDDIENINF